MRNSVLFILLIISSLSYSQDNFNLEKIATVQLNEDGNDIWGFVDGNGIEYAVMGGRTNTYIWSLEDPTNPVERIVIPGGPSTWRDMKHWEDHIYVTNDGSPDGLLVIDMSMAPETITFEYLTPTVNTVFLTDTLGQCHNLYIDENGFCYLSGCRIDGANKAIILDLNQDKKNPPIVGVHGSADNSEYSHDLYVQDNIMYSSEIFSGVLTLFDVSDKANIVELGDATTSMSFTHNCWASTDGNYAFTTDERANGYVDAYDVSDPSNIVRVDQFQPFETRGRGVIPHNTHYIDGYLVTSWYTDGVVITDAHRPENMIKVGQYDTYEFGDGGFEGCWGAYPWLPSGLVLASNLSNNAVDSISVGELNIFRPTYQRACYLEGTVTDAANGNPINAATVVILNAAGNEDISDALGAYKTGLATAGTFEVEFSHPEYFSKTLSAELDNGVVTILDAQLERLPLVTFDIEFRDALTGDLIPNGKSIISNSERTIELEADADGTLSTTLIDENYTEVVFGAWGYLHGQQNDIQFQEGMTMVFELMPGYQDDFIMDFNWTVNGNATTGQWVRDVPIATFRGGNIVNVNEDIQDDLGTTCYMTGNDGGQAGNDDVDGGLTRLTAPVFNVSDYENPILEFRYWFYTEPNNQNGPPNDTLFVNIWDKTNLTTLAMYNSNTNGWSDLVRIPLNGLVDIQEDLSLAFLIADDEPLGHLLEAAIDVFKVIDEPISSNAGDILDSSEILVYPNPSSDQFFVNLNDLKAKKVDVTNRLGQIIYTNDKPSNQFIINNISESGLYIMTIIDEKGHLLTKKIIKQN